MAHGGTNGFSSIYRLNNTFLLQSFYRDTYELSGKLCGFNNAYTNRYYNHYYNNKWPGVLAALYLFKLN